MIITLQLITILQLIFSKLISKFKICFIEKILVLIRKIQNVCFVLSICKESLTSLLHIDSCWVYRVLRSLTSLLYVIHMCRGSFTSPLMHYIICVMWVRAYHPFLHVMHVSREVNLASSSSWIYIAYNLYWLFYVYPFIGSLFWTKRGIKFICFVFTLTPLLMIDKKGEKNL